MSDREASVVWAAIPRTSRKVFEAIAKTIADNGGDAATISYLDLEYSHGCANNSIALSIRTLNCVGLIDIEPGPRLGRQYRLSDRWTAIRSETEVERLIAMAREIKSRGHQESGLRTPMLRGPQP